MMRTAFIFGWLAVCPLAGAQPDALLLVPPSLEGHVLYYDGFDAPEGGAVIDRLGAGRTAAQPPTLPEGFSGRGWPCPYPAGAAAPFELVSPRLSVHRPITVMFWFRVEVPIAAEQWLQLVTLTSEGGSGPLIRHFRAGRGDWAGLKEPALVVQILRFPGIHDYNFPWLGRSDDPAGQWQHVALTVRNGREVTAYRNGRSLGPVTAKGAGRRFEDGEVSRALLGSTQHPITIDEVLVLGVALPDDAIAAYHEAALNIREVGLTRPAGAGQE